MSSDIGQLLCGLDSRWSVVVVGAGRLFCKHGLSAKTANICAGLASAALRLRQTIDLRFRYIFDSSGKLSR